MPSNCPRKSEHDAIAPHRHPERIREGSSIEGQSQILREYAQDDTHVGSALRTIIRRDPQCGPYIAFLLFLTLLIGCHSATVTQPLPAQFMHNDPQSQMDFWHALTGRPVATNDETFHALLLFIDNKDTSPDYPARVSTLKRRLLIPGDFNRPPNESIQRGILAVAMVRILDVKGGLTMSLLGPSPRYATRELEYMGLYPQSSPNQTFSGAELIGIIGRMEDYQRSRNVNDLKPHQPVPLSKM